MASAPAPASAHAGCCNKMARTGRRIHSRSAFLPFWGQTSRIKTSVDSVSGEATCWLAPWHLTWREQKGAGGGVFSKSVNPSPQGSTLTALLLAPPLWGVGFQPVNLGGGDTSLQTTELEGGHAEQMIPSFTIRSKSACSRRCTQGPGMQN